MQLSYVVQFAARQFLTFGVTFFDRELGQTGGEDLPFPCISVKNAPCPARPRILHHASPILIAARSGKQDVVAWKRQAAFVAWGRQRYVRARSSASRRLSRIFFDGRPSSPAAIAHCCCGRGSAGTSRSQPSSWLWIPVQATVPRSCRRGSQSPTACATALARFRAQRLRSGHASLHSGFCRHARRRTAIAVPSRPSRSSPP